MKCGPPGPMGPASGPSVWMPLDVMVPKIFKHLLHIIVCIFQCAVICFLIIIVYSYFVDVNRHSFIISMRMQPQTGVSKQTQVPREGMELQATFADILQCNVCQGHKKPGKYET